MAQVLLQVPGVILVISCHKHLNTRVPQLKFTDTHVSNWPVLVVVGDPHIATDFILQGATTLTLTLRCEDSYLHIGKKAALAMSLLPQLFDIRYGVLRCNDDLTFNFDVLRSFLDEIGRGGVGDYVGRDGSIYRDFTKATHYSSWIIDYYRDRPEDFRNPLSGLQGKAEHFEQYCVFPTVRNASGPLMYLSNRACAEIVRCMEEVDYDIFVAVEGHGFPHIIDDISIGYMLTNAGYVLQHRQMYSDTDLVMEPWCLAHHTSMNK